MKRNFLLTLLVCLLLMLSRMSAAAQSSLYVPDDQELYTTIVRADSLFFFAYNHCDSLFEDYASFYADTIEFYHDRQGLSTSRKDILAGTKKYVCGKVTRHAVPGSLEVYPVNNFGAVEFGYHYFVNSEEPDTPVHPARFMIIWKLLDNSWKITRVVSLH